MHICSVIKNKEINMNTEIIIAYGYKDYFVDFYYTDYNTFMEEIKNLKKYDNNKFSKLQKRKVENNRYSKQNCNTVLFKGGKRSQYKNNINQKKHFNYGNQQELNRVDQRQEQDYYIEEREP